jgi:hypothetical protein
LALAIAAPASLALASPRSAGKKPKAIDVRPVIDKLDVYRDELGNYYVSPRPGAMKDDAEKWVLYGDRKTLYQQRIVGSSSDGKNYEWDLWSPRAKGLTTANLALHADGDLVIQCRRHDGQRKLTQLKADEARSLLRHAKIYPPKWQRVSRFLARDDDGVYYFVDQFREDLGGNGFRVFVGMKGAMKELPMKNVVTDSAGDIYATRGGSLKIVAGTNGKAYWIKKGKKVELTVLPPEDNRYLIYRDLGIYGQLGTVCDDL